MMLVTANRLSRRTALGGAAPGNVECDEYFYLDKGIVFGVMVVFNELPHYAVDWWEGG